jgi:hypothetical protein
MASRSSAGSPSLGHLSWARKKGDKEFLEGKVVFFAHPLRGLNDILDPSKATSARSRKLGLPDFVGAGRPQTCAFALRAALLGQDGCPKMS